MKTMKMEKVPLKRSRLAAVDRVLQRQSLAHGAQRQGGLKLAPRHWAGLHAVSTQPAAVATMFPLSSTRAPFDS